MTRPIRLRGEEPPDSAVIVVRGGLNGLTNEKVRETCADSFAGFGFYRMSVFAAIDQSLE